MNLQVLVALAEIVSALAVTLTLIALILLRSNRDRRFAASTTFRSSQ